MNTIVILGAGVPITQLLITAMEATPTPIVIVEKTSAVTSADHLEPFPIRSPDPEATEPATKTAPFYTSSRINQRRKKK